MADTKNFTDSGVGVICAWKYQRRLRQKPLSTQSEYPGTVRTVRVWLS